MAHCPACGGTLKPDFVYFGENVPKDRVERSYAMVDEAAGAPGGRLLADRHERPAVCPARRQAGQSRWSSSTGEPTRGDDLATIKLDAGVSEALTWLAAELPPL